MPPNEIQRKRKLIGIGKRRKASDVMTVSVLTAIGQDTLYGNADNLKRKSTKKCPNQTTDRSV